MLRTGLKVVDEEFQFPSNGKALSDPSTRMYSSFEHSKLFQFPSNGKALSDTRLLKGMLEQEKEFQFPSNGKALSDSTQFQPSGAVAP